MKILGVIPARYGSTRYPGKPLAMICGKPMIQHVYQRCLRAKMLDEVVVATDDIRIYNFVKGFNGQAVLTSRKHRSGSDRIAEVIRKPRYRGFNIILNIQGDEPLIDHRAINLLAKEMLDNPKEQMATLATNFKNAGDVVNSTTAKVVTDTQGRALYFSRCPIPFIRDENTGRAGPFLKHIGLYAYRRNFLLKFTQWPEGRLERLEKLEQLRALENGADIKVLRTNYSCLSVDSPGDVDQIERQMKRPMSRSKKPIN
ncbi:MAG: 3-deoxy-manno-octulosonate cytidylyltransferase [Candidatus Edwardsbacteria bacterium]|nr:3-deoxy-manno-octulosonate cytidylyltransferase [Candidatus Edwardsbacteria bacterium]